MNRVPMARFAILFVLSSLGLSLVATGHQSNWPNLSVLKSYPNPTGDTCSVDGNPDAVTGKKLDNRLKNRWTLPKANATLSYSQAEKLDFVGMSRIPLGPGGGSVRTNDPNQQRFVVIEGYVRSVKKGGSSGESCNCKATGDSQLDTHIEIVPDSSPQFSGTDGKGMIVVETTERSRRLAKLGLLKSNIGNDWSLTQLRSRLLGRRVKFWGYLYYDGEHHKESWRSDPQNHQGRSNWRETCWEVHPVMGIEKL